MFLAIPCYRDNKIIPFRDSRLTRLFQNFFCGRGKAAMIVNVSQCASMFDETLNVFKFSAIAKQVLMHIAGLLSFLEYFNILQQSFEFFFFNSPSSMRIITSPAAQSCMFLST